jgi:hypothetical protein
VSWRSSGGAVAQATKCSGCGSSFGGTDTFCRRCGARRTIVETSEPAGRLSPVWPIGGVLVALIAVVATIAVVLDRTSQPAPPGGQTEAYVASSEEAALVAAETPAVEPVAPSYVPLRQGKVDSAYKEFRRVYGQTGIAGLAVYSEQCFSALRASADFGSLDFCIAFDEMARTLDASAARTAGFPRTEYFYDRLVADRQAAAAVLIIVDPQVRASRLAAIRSAARLTLERELDAEERSSWNGNSETSVDADAAANEAGAAAATAAAAAAAATEAAATVD